MSQPDLSIIVPIYNRPELLRYSLESVARARGSLQLEVIVVDDGSEPRLDPALAPLQHVGARLIRQDNQGLLFGRLRGFAEATGRYTLFLDSDDLVGREKLTTQVAAMDRSGVDVSYTDTSRCVLQGAFDSLTFLPDSPTRETTGMAEFFIVVQPAPHSPMWRTEFLRRVVSEPLFQPSPLYNHVAEIWFYHNASILSGRVLKVPGPHTAIGQHPDARLTNHWERLGVASLAVMEAFARRCPATDATATARQLVAEQAFRSWRALPRDFSPEFCRRELGVWRRLHSTILPAQLGGPLFQNLARIFGVAAAGSLLRLCNPPYRSCRTLDDETLIGLLAKLPPP